MEFYEAKRVSPSTPPHERTVLLETLDWLRQLIIDGCETLSDEQARTSLVASKTTPLGIVRHLVAVEHYWFRYVLCDGEMSDDWRDGGDGDPEWDVAGLGVHPVLDTYRATISEVNSLIGNVDLDAMSINTRHGEYVSLRWILVHMIEETARHSGHMDILVEQLHSKE